MFCTVFIAGPSPSYGNSVTSAITTFTPTPSTTFTPSTSVIEPLTSFSSSSVALIAKSSSNDNSITSVTLTSVTLTHLTTTPLPVTTQVMRPLSSSLLFHRMVSVTHLSPRPSSSSSPTPSNTMVAGATIGETYQKFLPLNCLIFASSIRFLESYVQLVAGYRRCWMVAACHLTAGQHQSDYCADEEKVKVV